MAMHLVSCDYCGIVLDASKVRFPGSIYDEMGEVDPTKAVWHNRDYEVYIPCPVCKQPIVKDQ